VAVSGVSLNKTTLKLVNGNDESIGVTVSPSNATKKDVTTKSSNTSVATASITKNQLTGDPLLKITAKSPGTATVTVTTTDGNKTATCEVTVLPAAPTNVKATKNSETSITVSWSSVSGATSYKVYYVGDSSSDLILDGTTSTTSYKSEGWSGTGMIYYKVTAISGGQESGYTAGATANINNGYGAGNPKK
jgi:uncharacterized protein YjdB